MTIAILTLCTVSGVTIHRATTRRWLKALKLA